MYLYRKEIEEFVAKHRWSMFGVCVGATALYYILPGAVDGKFYIAGVDLFTVETLLLFSLWLSYAIGAKSRFMDNRFMKYFGGISMEMYLAQMVAFRVIEKAGLLYKFGYGWVSYIVVFMFCIMLLILVVESWKRCIVWIRKVRCKSKIS